VVPTAGWFAAVPRGAVPSTDPVSDPALLPLDIFSPRVHAVSNSSLTVLMNFAMSDVLHITLLCARCQYSASPGFGSLGHIY